MEEYIDGNTIPAQTIAPLPVVDTVGVIDQAEVIVSRDNSNRILEILKTPSEAAQIEPGRLDALATEIAQEIEKNKVVDWQTRETIQAHLRNLIRIILRKYGYPVAPREDAVEAILESALGGGEEEAIA